MKFIFSLNWCRKIKLLCILLFAINAWCEGQSIFSISRNYWHPTSKRPIDSEALGKWPSLYQPRISNDGKYFGYVISDEDQSVNRIVVVDSTGNFVFESNFHGWFEFSRNSQFVVFVNSYDSLCIKELTTSYVSYVSDVSNFYIVGDYICYCSKSNTGVLYVMSIHDREGGICIPASKWFMKSGKSSLLILVRDDNSGNQVLYLLDVSSRSKVIVWEGRGFHSVIIDSAFKQFVVASDSSQSKLVYASLHRSFNIEIPPEFNVNLDNIGHFSIQGDQVFLNISPNSNPLVKRKEVGRRIWSYTDTGLQSRDIAELDGALNTAIFRISDMRFLKLGIGSDWLFFSKLQDSIVLIRHQAHAISGTEKNWNLAGLYQWRIFSTLDGAATEMNFYLDNKFVQLSPLGRYVISFDEVKKQYFAYEIETGELRCITSGIEEEWEKDIYRGSYGKYIAGWETDDNAVLVYGSHDIWRIDPSGRKLPVNLTNGYGRRFNIIFSLALDEYDLRGLLKGESVVLIGFNTETKDNGFYSTKYRLDSDPVPLSVGPFIYDIPDNPYLPQSVSFPPIRALNAKCYIVRRMSAEVSPNFFFTRDFRSFIRLSSNYPEKNYNWYTSELHTWLSLDSSRLKGILYKPQNFDSSTKYPVIFYYYENKSDGLNAYHVPRSLDDGCIINIPYYVSNGYLVFCPDIHYSIGDPMTGSYNAIISAADYIGKLPYVDRNRIGLAGCSWGAVQTNYIVTHSSLFAAACSASGLGNWISSYGGLVSSGESMMGMYEFGQLRMGTTLWDKLDVYVKNSAVFSASNVHTPLLLMHTTFDEMCPFANIIEFFTLLRRLGRRAWLLEYQGNHLLLGAAANDFSVRMKQFFDHYLQNKRPPRWMVKGNINGSGLELDDSIKTPEEGLLISDFCQ